MSDWRSGVTFSKRYEIVEKLRKSIAAGTLGRDNKQRKSALQIESEAYNTSESREAYDAACLPVTGEGSSLGAEYLAQEIKSTPIPIGKYQECYHIAGGLVSEVYRSNSIALKVITETRNVEPHNPAREVKILTKVSYDRVIKLQETFRDEGRLVLVFPFMPYTLGTILSGAISQKVIRTCFHDLFSALSFIHDNGIIHRDIKPSNLLLASPTGPAYLCDFGTAWDPSLSIVDEPPEHKILEVGTTCYRAPETLFGNRKYDMSLDMWAAGVMLAECIRQPTKPLFESRDTSEDGNQLGLILSMFKTIGTPTMETWPEAATFSTPPFEWYQRFLGHSWAELLPGVYDEAKDLVEKLVKYEGRWRLTATEALKHKYFDLEG